MSITLQVKVNGGAAQTGGVVCAEGDSIQLTAASKVGWDANSARFEISDFPEEFECPAGWSVDGTTGAFYYANANQDPPAFVLTTWGKFMLSLRASEGSGATTTTDTATAIDCRSALGMTTVGRGEGAVFGGLRKRWVASIQRALRFLYNLIAWFVTTPPTGDASGASDRAAFNARLAYGNLRLRPEGVYYVDQPISVPSGRKIIGNGCTIIPTYASGLAFDDDDNAVFLVHGVETVTVNTTLAADVPAGALAITTVASVPSDQAGKYLRLSGSNPADTFLMDSTGVVVTEWVQVSASHPGGTTVAIQRPTHIAHDSSHTVNSGEPLTDARVEGVFVDATGNDTVGYAVHIKDAVRVHVQEFSGRIFSRSVYGAEDSQSITTDGITNRGSCNGTLYRASVHGGYFRNTRRTSEGARTHVNGYPQHELMMHRHCVACFDDGGLIEHACGGLRQWGGIGCLQANFVINDLDITELVDRDPNYATDATVGIVYDGGSGQFFPIERTGAFSFGCGVANIRATNVRAKNTVVVDTHCQSAIYFHDQWGFHLSNVAVENIGEDPTNGGPPLSGMVISDAAGGSIVGLRLRGIDMGIRWQNVTGDVWIDDCELVGRAGTVGGNAIGPALWFANNGGPRKGAKIGSLIISGFGSDPPTLTDVVFKFNSEWIDGDGFGPDLSLNIDRLNLDGYEYRDVRPVKCVAFAYGPVEGPHRGQVISIDPITGIAAPATTPTRRDVICVGFPHAGYAMAAFGDATVLTAASPLIQGDSLIAGPAGFPVAGSPPAYPAVWYEVVGRLVIGYVLCKRRP